MNTTFRKPYFKGPGTPLLNSGSWNPALHPRDPSNVEFIYTDGGLHGRSSSQKGKPLGKSVIETALGLSIDPNTNRHNGTATNPYISHYGYSEDATPDTNSDKRKLGAFGSLGPYSLAIGDNVARTNGLIRNKPVYANGQFFGIYNDRAPEQNTIDVYDPSNRAGSQNRGGTVKGGIRISSSPR
jgi:hypothetical protein